MDMIKTLGSAGIIPVIVIEDLAKAVPLARALVKGGLPVLEVTFRTACAAEAIAKIKAEVPGAVLGAGTVLTREQLLKAKAAGATFAVAPGFDPEIVKAAAAEGVPFCPGIATASELSQALALGCKMVKFFPAEAAGGLPVIKAMSAPYGNIRFMPTGGINAKNITSYLDYEKIVACGGTWMVKKDMINNHEWEKITSICKESVKTMLGLSLAHVGINCENAAEAEKTAKTLCALFGFEYKAGNSSDFAGSAVECMKAPYLGKNGHIAIGTNSIDRAMYHLGTKGVEFYEFTRKTVAKGNKKAI